SKIPRDGSWEPGSKNLYVRGGWVRFAPHSSKLGSRRKTLIARVFVNDNQWHHAVLTSKANVKGSRDRTILYVDGVERARRDDWNITADDDSKLPIKLGVACDPVPTDDLAKDTHFPTRTHLVGQLDEVAVYDRCLSVEDVEAHYRAFLIAGISRRGLVSAAESAAGTMDDETVDDSAGLDISSTGAR